MNTRAWLSLILALYVLLAFGYSVLMPAWEAPDETAHYLVAYYLARRGRMPTMEETYEAVQPPGYYWLAALVLRELEQIDPALTNVWRAPLTLQSDYTRYAWTDENYHVFWGMLALRWLNIAVSAMTLFFIYKGSRAFWAATTKIPEQWVASASLSVVALVALTPQFLHNTAAVNNDALANACGALLFWALVGLSLRPLAPRRVALLLLAAIAFPILVKLTLLPISMVTLLILLWRTQWRRFLVLGGAGLLLAMAAGLAWLAPQSAELLWRTFWWRVVYMRPDLFDGWELARILKYYVAGYWGQVGWKFAALPPALLLLLTAAALAGALSSLRLLFSTWPLQRFWRWLVSLSTIGTATLIFLAARNDWWRLPWLVMAAFWAVLLVVYWRQRRRDPAHQLQLPPAAWRAIWLVVALALTMVIKNSLTTPQYQARFLFPALGPFTMLAIAGWVALLPVRQVPYLPHTIILLFVVLNLFFWVDTILPIFYQPF